MGTGTATEGGGDLRSILTAAANALRDLDIDSLTDLELEEVILLTARTERTAEATQTEALATHQSRKAYEAVGARSSAAQFAAELNLPRAHVAARVGLGRRLRHAPHTAAAWRTGMIAEIHARGLTALRTDRTADAFARDEETLVALAVEKPFAAFQGSLAYWRQLHDPDDAAGDAASQWKNRNLHHSQTFQGGWEGRWSSDPVSGAIVNGQLEAITKELYEADVAEARERLGRDPLDFELARTPAQRRHDALVEMARRSAKAHSDGPDPVVLLNVFIDYPTLDRMVSELGNGAIVHPHHLLPWLDSALLRRVVFDSHKRVLEISEKRRLYQGATRDAVLVRDRSCFQYYCDYTYDGWYVEVDHIQPHSHGGATTTVNGQLGCAWHNKWKWRTVDQFLDDLDGNDEPTTPPDTS